MSFRTSIRVSVSEDYTVLIVEPWAEEFVVAARENCQVVALNPDQVPTFEVEPLNDGRLIVYVNESGSSFEFWRGDARELLMPVAIP